MLRKLFFIVALLLNILVNVNIYLNHYSHIYFLLWLTSLLFFILAGLKNYHFSLKKISWSNLTILIFVGIFPLLVRILLLNLNRAHGDDLIGAYLVDTMNIKNFNLFSGFPQIATEWESQFPPLFFILQKIFFSFFGTNLLTVKLSIFPYVSIVNIMLFLVTQKFFGRKTAYVAIFLYSYLAINLYLETVGLWIVSGSAVFLVFFYFMLKNLKSTNMLSTIMMGIACGFCYLFYFTSYIAFVLMGIIYFFNWLRAKNRLVLRNFLVACLACILVVSPFVTYSIKYNNYLFQRVDQVALLTGEWSVAPQEIASGKNPLSFIKAGVLSSLRSFSQNDIGGQGGVNFGYLALFDTYTRILLLAGILTAFYLLVRKNKTELILIFFVLVLSFFTMVFSIPPPAYHRFALAFPFLCIIAALPFYLLFMLKNLPSLLKYFFACLIISLFISNNLAYFSLSVINEKYYETLRISDFINTYFPNRNVYMAGYPGFGFEKFYYFSRGKNARRIGEEYHDTYLKNFNKNEKYVYVILLPDAFNEKFKSADPNGKIIKISTNYSLFVN